MNFKTWLKRRRNNLFNLFITRENFKEIHNFQTQPWILITAIHVLYNILVLSEEAAKNVLVKCHFQLNILLSPTKRNNG